MSPKRKPGKALPDETPWTLAIALRFARDLLERRQPLGGRPYRRLMVPRQVLERLVEAAEKLP